MASRARLRRPGVAADGWGEGSRHMTVVGWLPTRPLGAAMLEAELLAACAGGSRPPVRSSLAINSGAAPRPLRACSESPQLEGE